MDLGHQPDREPIGELLARLIDDARTLAKAELALFRTDFYRRIGRARTGALLLLGGAIMGQAAAVTALVTLSFVLTPWLGRLGAAAASVALGVGLAVLLIRIGARKLLLVVEDVDDEESEEKKALVNLDELFEKVRMRSREARTQLAETVDETQARLHPQALLADLVDELVDHAQMWSHKAVDAARQRPIRVAATLAAIVMVVVRPPIYRIAAGIGRATRIRTGSFRKNQAGEPAQRQNGSSAHDD